MADHELSTLLEGGAFFEGPRWRDGRWWVSDFYRGIVSAVTPDGVAETVLEVPQQPSGLVLYNSAVLAEIMRAGILSLPRGQREAAQARGLNYHQAMRHVILPLGLRRMVPATVSQLITLTKDTTLVSIIAIVEVMRRARTVTATSGNPFTGGGVEAPILEVFLFVGLLFIIFNYSLSRLSRRLEIREKKRSGSKPDVKVRGLEEQVA